MATTLSEINNTLLSIKRDTAVTARRLSGKGSSAEEAREGLKERTKKRDAIAKPTAPAVQKKSGGGGGGGILGAAINWAKWFGLAGLAVWFKDEIWEFLRGAFEPFQKDLKAWWDGKKKSIGEAWEGVLEASGFKWLGKQLDDLGLAMKPFTDWFKSAPGKLDKWLEDSFLGSGYKSMKDMLMGSMGTDELGNETGREGGLFGGITKVFGDATSSLGGYFSGLGTAFGKVFDALGITEDGEITKGAAAVGLGALAAAFIVGGPISMAIKVFKGIASLAGLMGKVTWAVVAGGFKAVAGMAGLRAASGAGAAATQAATSFGGGPGGAATRVGSHAAGTVRMLGKTPIVMNDRGMWVDQKTGKGIRAGQMPGFKGGPGTNAGHSVSQKAIGGASKSSNLVARMSGGVLRFMGGMLTNPIVIGAAVLGMAGYAAYQGVQKMNKNVDAEGAVGADKARARIAAAKSGTGPALTIKEKALHQAAGLGKTDESVAKKNAAIAKIEEEKKAIAESGDSSYMKEQKTEALVDKQKNLQKAIDDEIGELNRKFGGEIGRHNSGILRGVIERIYGFGITKKGQLIGPNDRFPLQPILGEGRRKKFKEYKKSYSAMLEWAANPANSDKKITLGVLKNFGIRETKDLKLSPKAFKYNLGGEMGGGVTNQAELMSKLGEEGGIESYARGFGGSAFKSTTKIAKEAQRLEALMQEKQALEKTELVNQAARRPRDGGNPAGSSAPVTVVSTVDRSSSTAAPFVHLEGSPGSISRAVNGGYGGPF
jgi:hypothetical protein